MKINGKEYLSPQEQLFENTKDIEELKQVIKPVYQTTATLTSSSVSVALADTNVGDATEGWLMTTDGLLFKITANDGTTVLLIYYAKLSGEDGTNAIDDSTTANNKLWSSLKTSNEIAKAKDKGIYFTTTQPTYDSGLYYLDEGYFDNVNSDIPIKAYDLLVYIDSNDKVKEIYKVLSKTGNNWSLDKIGAIGGGKQLYQHNVSLYYVYNTRTLQAFFTIINDSGQALTFQDIYNYLDSLNLKYDGDQYNKLLQVSGRYENSAQSQIATPFGMYINTQNVGCIRFAYMLLNGNVNYLAFNSATIYDYIQTL